MILALALLLAPVPAEAVDDFRPAEAMRNSQPMRARTLYERSARYGYAPAQATYGLLLFKDGNRIGALRWVKAASDQGEPRGMLLWGTALFNGDGVATDRVLGYSLVARAAKSLTEAEGTRSEMQLVMSPSELAAAAKLIAPVKLAEQTAPASATKPSAKGKRSVPKSSAPKRAATKNSAAASAKSTSEPAVARKPTLAITPTPAAATGAWRIQLGAFREDGSAEKLFARLATRLPGKQPTYLPLGNMTRLLAGPYPTKASAQAACRSLGASQPCFLVGPR
jgi:cell division septation protein DedD